MKTKDYVKCKNCGEEVNISKELDEVRQESLLNLREKEKVITDMKGQLGSALRKAEQGSQQLQGEVQELEIINILRDLYPHDKIEQSKKGANAADIMQVVKLQDGSTCGKIYLESKRCKSWSYDWIEKLKIDNLTAKADILVLVTSVLPKDIQRFGNIDGVWVCSFNEIKELSLVLRFGLIKVHSVISTQDNKEAKMQALYDFLISEEFKNLFESIISGYKTIQKSHADEKLKMLRLWKEREKSIDLVLANTITFYASLKGIVGTSVPEIEMLQISLAD
jgi:hypothetical protein